MIVATSKTRDTPLAGRTAEARVILRDLEARAERSYVSTYHLAYVYTGLGEADRAIACLERAVADSAGAVYAFNGSFLFRTLHAHPGYRRLVGQLRLAQRPEAPVPQRSPLALSLMVAGLVLLAAGALAWIGALSWFGRLPGDIRIERPGMRFYLPITSMVIASLLLTLLAALVRRLWP